MGAINFWNSPFLIKGFFFLFVCFVCLSDFVLFCFFLLIRWLCLSVKYLFFLNLQGPPPQAAPRRNRSMSLSRDNYFRALYCSPCTKTYRYPDVDGTLVLVQEIMVESRLSFSIPQQMMWVYFLNYSHTCRWQLGLNNLMFFLCVLNWYVMRSSKMSLKSENFIFFFIFGIFW